VTPDEAERTVTGLALSSQLRRPSSGVELAGVAALRYREVAGRFGVEPDTEVVPVVRGHRHERAEHHRVADRPRCDDDHDADDEHSGAAQHVANPDPTHDPCQDR